MISYGDIKSGEATMPARASGLALDVIQIDGGTQSRASLNQTVVDEYAAAIQDGATFPPIVVFYDGDKHWLADGFHRFHAYRQIGRATVEADIRQGTRRDAILHSVGANETHGLRRTNEDKRRAVLTLLGDAEWSKWSHREIARRCAVGADMVGRLRPTDTVAERQYVHPKTGKATTMKTAGINASRKGGDERQEIASETLATQGVEGGDEPQKQVEEITAPRNIFDELVALWKEAGPGVRQDFKAYIRGSEFVARNNLTESNQATGKGGGDVDRSAERASSAVKVGATNSPDRATRRLDDFGSVQDGLKMSSNGLSAGVAEQQNDTVHVSVTDETGGESAATVPVAEQSAGKGQRDRQHVPSRQTDDAMHGGQDQSAAALDHAPNSSLPANPKASPARQADRAPEVPPPASGATPFENPRCQHPDTCHFANSREACHDCLMAWAQRPKDEQIRLWAEANEAAA